MVVLMGNCSAAATSIAVGAKYTSHACVPPYVLVQASRMLR
jgi:hypothetical protein